MVEHDGERRGTLDIKSGGLLPVVDIARWAAMSAGAPRPRRAARLEAAERAGTLDSRTSHRRCGSPSSCSPTCAWSTRSTRCDVHAQPDDSIDPRTLAPLTRRYLKDAFRAVADVQRGLANEFGLTGL